VRAKGHKATHCVVFSTSLLRRPLCPIYSPQRSILRHPLPKFVPKLQRPILLKKQQENYSYVNIDIYIFRNQTGRQNNLHVITAHVP